MTRHPLATLLVMIGSIVGTACTAQSEPVTDVLAAQPDDATPMASLDSILWKADESGTIRVATRIKPVRIRATNWVGDVVWETSVEANAPERALEIRIAEQGVYTLIASDDVRSENRRFFVVPVDELEVPDGFASKR